MLWLHEDLHVRSHADAPVLSARAPPVVQAQGEVLALEARSLRASHVSRFMGGEAWRTSATVSVQ